MCRITGFSIYIFLIIRGVSPRPHFLIIRGVAPSCDDCVNVISTDIKVACLEKAALRKQQFSNHASTEYEYHTTTNMPSTGQNPALSEHCSLNSRFIL